MKQYSFLLEGNGINNLLAVSGMTALGDKGGSYVGSKIGKAIANSKYKKIDPDTISWSDPEFLDIVRKSLYQAKNDAKVAREWYLSCDKSDKHNARKDYLEAINNYKEIQRDIADRNPYRWLSEYKQMKINKFSDTSKGIGRTIGIGVGGIGTGLALLKGKR